MHHGDVLSQTYCKAGITSKRQINFFFGRYLIQEFSPYSPVSFLAAEKPAFPNSYSIWKDGPHENQLI